MYVCIKLLGILTANMFLNYYRVFPQGFYFSFQVVLQIVVTILNVAEHYSNKGRVYN